MARDGSEDQAQEAIVEWLNVVLPVKEIIHIPNEGHRSKAEGARQKRLGLRKGAADLLVLIPKRLIVIEVKRAACKASKKRAGKSTTEQIDFGLRVNAMGHPYFVAESIDDCRRAFELLGVETREAR